MTPRRRRTSGPLALLVIAGVQGLALERIERGQAAS